MRSAGGIWQASVLVEDERGGENDKSGDQQHPQRRGARAVRLAVLRTNSSKSISPSPDPSTCSIIFSASSAGRANQPGRAKDEACQGRPRAAFRAACAAAAVEMAVVAHRQWHCQSPAPTWRAPARSRRSGRSCPRPVVDRDACARRPFTGAAARAPHMRRGKRGAAAAGAQRVCACMGGREKSAVRLTKRLNISCSMSSCSGVVPLSKCPCSASR